MSQGNKPKGAARQSKVAERISYTATAEPDDWNGGTEDVFEQPDPLNHSDSMSRFMEQCCQPDTVETNEVIHQSTASANDEEEYYEGYTPGKEYYERHIPTTDPSLKKPDPEDTKFYEGYTLEYQARAEYTEDNNRGPLIPYYGRDEDGRILSGPPVYNDGDSRYGDGASYGSYSSHEDDEGSDEDYDSDFV